MKARIRIAALCFTAAATVAVVGDGAWVAVAQTEDHDAPMATPSTSDPASSAYQDAMDRLVHNEMRMELTGDPDVDFARNMIAHHQGAIAMARIELDYGEDPELRKLAEAVIEAQEAEIVFPRRWLEENGE